MKYSTTCTHCESVFLLTAEQLDAAQGWAQCSVCGAAFNAHATLAAENGDPLPLEVEAPLTEETVDNIAENSPTIESSSENVLSDSFQPEDQMAAVADQDELAARTDEHAIPHLHGIENRMAGPALTSIILIDPDEQATDDYGPLPEFAKETPATSDSVYRPNYSGTPVAPHQPIEYVSEPDVSIPTRAKHTPRRIPDALWGLASVLFAVGLIAQLGYFLRDNLASKMPATRPWLERACDTLGCKLSLPRDAKLIQIIGSDLQAEPASKNQLKLKLTLGNRATYAQAWPVLVLTLNDHNDQAQARRSFAPSEYLADQALLDSGIAAQSEHPLSLPLEVHNLTLAGYRLEVNY